MKDKIILITGAAGSIAKPMSIEFAKRGATVVMAGRGKIIMNAVEEVKKASGSPRTRFVFTKICESGRG